MGSGCSARLLLCFSLWAILALRSRSLVQEEFDALWSFKGAVKEDSDTSDHLSSWNASHSGPCGWFGVSCSVSQDHVVRLTLFNCSLKGILSQSISSLSYLQELTLGWNMLSGSIPKEIGALKALNVLDLSNNHLSGFIPPEIGALSSILKIYLSNNQLSGSLPLELGNLACLEELRLDGNMLGGPIPATRSSNFSHVDNNVMGSYKSPTGLCLLNQLKVADFSFNFFTGVIPSCLCHISRSSFRGNCFLDGSGFSPETEECKTQGHGPSSEVHNPTDKHENTQFKHQKPKQLHWFLALEIIIGAVLVVSIVICLLAAFRTPRPECCLATLGKRKLTKDEVAYHDDTMLKNILKLTRQEIEIACEDFSNIISSTCGNVYKGTIKDGTEIAVLSLCATEEDWTSYQQLHFQHEISNLARLNHDNVAKLLGYCEETIPFSRMIVFQYEPNGTLSEHLHYSGECQLTWYRRMRIVVGVACGLRYMHTELWPPYSLSLLRSSTVYLTEEFSPKLVDFGSWKVEPSKFERSRSIIGRRALCMPKETSKGKNVDVQDNIFAFGLLLLEIISGRPLFCKDKGCLVDWAIVYLEKNMIGNLVDPELRYFNPDDLQTICNVIKLCIQSDPSKRPSMEILTDMVESGINMSISDPLNESHLPWTELALSP